MVSRGVFEQVMWERDVAIEQLKELGYGLGEKPKTGHWIRVDKDKCKCDQCEVISFIAMYPNGNINYCPNCGACMKDCRTLDEFIEDSKESEEG